MKLLSVFLSFSLALGAAAQTPERPAASTEASAELSTAPFIEVSTITVRAPRPLSAEEIRVLRTARAGGAAVGVAGAGLMAYTLVLGLSGPFGWAASLIFLGGMTSYLSHRRLQGYSDFPRSRPPAQGVYGSTAAFADGAR